MNGERFDQLLRDDPEASLAERIRLQAHKARDIAENDRETGWCDDIADDLDKIADSL